MASRKRNSALLFLQICFVITQFHNIGGHAEAVYEIVDESAASAGAPELIQLAPLDQSPGLLVRAKRQAPSTSTTAPSSTTGSTTSKPTVSTVESTTTSTTTTTTTTTPTPPTTTTTSTTTTTTPAVDTTETPIILESNQTYYDSYVKHGTEAQELWVDEETIRKHGGKVHVSLSDNHRVAATITLKFKFLFYGHEINQVTIATGGFVYVSEFLHQWLTATQYIAPLMANFDTTVGNVSRIHYVDSGTYFVVWWEDVHLQDNQDAGNFSFQTIIHQDGRVIFNYRHVPIDIRTISTTQHPVKVGMSDAYYIDTTTGTNVKRRTIYEYHRVEIDIRGIKNNSAVIIKPKPTCIQQDTCEHCLTARVGFNCQFCSDVGRCSDGLDRHRQEWLNTGCHLKEKLTVDECPPEPEKHISVPGKKKAFAGGLSPGGLAAIIVILSLIIALTVIFVYAYYKPQTPLGMWLIEHRPSQLRERLSNVRFFKRGGDNADKYEVSMQPEPEGGESVA